jgi:chromosome segregation ATPase/ribosomal protein S27E
MADFRFHCPVCQQRILVDDSAAGISIDCPSCRSVLVIPSGPLATVEVIEKRHPSAVGAGAESVVLQLNQKKKELEQALAESARWKAQSEGTQEELRKLRAEIEVTKLEREHLRQRHEQVDMELRQLNFELQQHAGPATRVAALAAVASDQEAQKEVQALKDRIAAVEKEREDARVEATRIREEWEKVAGILQLSGGFSSEAVAAKFKEASSALDEAHAEANRTKGEVTALASQIESLKTKNEETLTELTKLREQHESTAAELNTRKTAGEQTSAELEKLKQHEQALSSEKDGLQAKLAQSADELEKLRQDLQAAGADRDGMKEKVSSALADLQKSQADLDLMRSDLTTAQRKLRDLGECFAMSERERVELIRKLAQSDATKELNQTREKVAVLQSQLSSSQAMLQTLRGERDRVRQQLLEREAMQAQATEKEGQLAEKEQQLAEKEMALQETGKALQEIQSKWNLAQKELTETAAARAASETSLTQLRSQLEAQIIRATSATQRIDGLETELAQRVAEIGMLRHEMNQVIEKEKNAREALKHHEDTTKDLSAQVERFREGEKIFQRQLTELSALSVAPRTQNGDHRETKPANGDVDVESPQFLDRVRLLEEERDHLREEVEGMRQGLERSKQHIGALQKRRDQMREEILKLRGKLGITPEVVAG